jgi:prepilin-type N-terminal cleavage/methylation domain-containing protein
MKKSHGFTLIELMIVVAIIGILSAIAIPKFADLIRKSNEGSTKGNLGAIRSAISIYYGELEGWFPVPTAAGDQTVAGSLGSLLTMENGKYLANMPSSYEPPYHTKTFSMATITLSSANEGNAADAGLWGYKNVDDGNGMSWGSVWVNCTHTDSKSAAWGGY